MDVDDKAGIEFSICGPCGIVNPNEIEDDWIGDFETDNDSSKEHTEISAMVVDVVTGCSMCVGTDETTSGGAGGAFVHEPVRLSI